jgi:hypothetical protein
MKVSDRTRKRWPFKTGDCLIEVTTWAGFTVFHLKSQLKNKLFWGQLLSDFNKNLVQSEPQIAELALNNNHSLTPNLLKKKCSCIL